jgi:iron-sulfur cluster assembly protein
MSSINLTDKAVDQIKKAMEKMNINNEEKYLSVIVEGGGCKGVNYKLEFQEKAAIDVLNSTICKFSGINTVIGNNALSFLDGTTIDFFESVEKSGFIFDNPNYQKGGSCGCS